VQARLLQEIRNPEPRPTSGIRARHFHPVAREPTAHRSTPAIRSAPCKRIEHTLRALDRVAADEQPQLQRLEKTLTDYQAQAKRPFEHEAQLKELLARQAQLNAAVDLDKSDAQAAEPVPEPDIEAPAPLCRSESLAPRTQPNSLQAP
jgi:hypothetical protein